MIPITGTLHSTWPRIEPDEIDAVQQVLSSGKINYWSGTEGKQFETEFADYMGTRYAIALSNGTVALEAALYAAGIQQGDEVITTPRTFIASASAIVFTGAIPIIADIDADNQNISAKTIAACITAKTKAVICVHLAGHPCDMDPIMELARKHRLTIIEDCAQSHGAEYKGKKVGSIGHIGCFSFCQDKIMTTGGEGGMLITNDTELWSKAWSYKDHGKSYDTVFNTNHPPGFRWLHESWGTNGRMTEMQAAIGRVQLKKLDTWLNKRQENATALTRFLKQNDAIHIPNIPQTIRHANYKFYCFAKDSQNRDTLLTHFKSFGLSPIAGSCPNITHEKCFQSIPGQYQKPLPVADELGKKSIMFLIDHTVTYHVL